MLELQEFLACQSVVDEFGPVPVQDVPHPGPEAALADDRLLGHLLHQLVVGLEVVLIVVLDLLYVPQAEPVNRTL